MTGGAAEHHPIRTDADVVIVRKIVRNWAQKMQFRLVDSTRVVTAASEIARNTLDYGGGGEFEIREVQVAGRAGMQMIFSDQGPGIANIEQAMQDGFTTGRGLGMGLSGTKRLMDDFAIESAPGRGTRITIVKWK